MLQAWCVLYILTSTCASRHICAHFFNIPTAKTGSNIWCFSTLTSKLTSRHNGIHFSNISIPKRTLKLRCLVHFDLEMCFAPHRRAADNLSFAQMALHPPLWQDCFSTFRSSFFFSSLLFSDTSHLCFSSVNIVGSLTSKLPSLIYVHNLQDGWRIATNFMWRGTGVVCRLVLPDRECFRLVEGTPTLMVAGVVFEPEHRD